jgi:hypothetical protein
LADGCPSGTPERQAASRGIHIRSNADAKRNADLRMLIADLKLLDEFNQHSAFSIQQSAISNRKSAFLRWRGREVFRLSLQPGRKSWWGGCSSGTPERQAGPLKPPDICPKSNADATRQAENRREFNVFFPGAYWPVSG